MMSFESLPTIIQGGMGAGVSGWRLARAVAKTGQLGVVSGTGLDAIMVRRLQIGDLSGDVRRALDQFPIPGVARRIIQRYYIAGGKGRNEPFRAKPVPAVVPSRELESLLVASNFVEVFLAREGHNQPVGINYLEKIQLPTLPSLYGAMLAGVGCVLMGAGIPKSIPGILDRLADGQPVELKLDVQNADRDDEFCTRFDPRRFSDGRLPSLQRPMFLAIIASSTLATMLVKKSSGRVDGFVIEGPTAGGHNAPPRGHLQLSSDGEPLYGQRDEVDLEAVKKLGRPFWLAGSYGKPERVSAAVRAGAAGVQVGTAFAYCEESDLDGRLKQRVLAESLAGTARVFTDPVASPTGFPFKVVQLAETISEDQAYQQRRRVCDLGYLRRARKGADGKLLWLCPSEPVADYARKGGEHADTCGRKCVCNSLMANIGLEQVQRWGREQPLVTSGDDVANVGRFVRPGRRTYHARDVVEYLLSNVSMRLCTAC